MPRTRIRLTASEELLDALVGLLEDQGLEGTVVDSADGACVQLFLSPESDLTSVRSIIELAFHRTGLPIPALEVREVEERDWTAEWRRSQTAFPVGERFYVVPSWDRTPIPPDRIPIFIDPGQAFGTGTHESTQLVLEDLETLVHPGSRVCDIGTGSAILAIAAHRLGAGSVLACDTDPVAVDVARENIARNPGVLCPVMIGSTELFSGGCTDLLLANLTAEPIALLMPEFHRLVSPGGCAVFSGILNSQEDEVVRSAELAGFRPRRLRHRGEWTGMVVDRT